VKVALLISGLPRMVKEGFEHTWSHIINNYDTDVYLHSWRDNSWGSKWEDIYEVYNIPQVKSLHIQSPFKFTSYKEGIKLPHSDTSRPLPEYDVISCFRQFPMFYSWQKVYQNYYDTKIQYDCVIRSRYDLKINAPINLESLNLNVLNHGSGGMYYDDNLCVTNQENAHKIFFNIFDKLVSYSRDKGILNNAEHSWTDLINLSKCEPRINNRLDFTLLRENHLWWGN
jgi:hypothetical protein